MANGDELPKEELSCPSLYFRAGLASARGRGSTCASLARPSSHAFCLVLEDEVRHIAVATTGFPQADASCTGWQLLVASLLGFSEGA